MGPGSGQRVRANQTSPVPPLLGMMLGAGQRSDTGRWLAVVVGATPILAASSFCSIWRALSLRRGEKKGGGGHTDLYYYLCRRAREGEQGT